MRHRILAKFTSSASLSLAEAVMPFVNDAQASGGSHWTNSLGGRQARVLCCPRRVPLLKVLGSILLPKQYEKEREVRKLGGTREMGMSSTA